MLNSNSLLPIDKIMIYAKSSVSINKISTGHLHHENRISHDCLTQHDYSLEKSKPVSFCIILKTYKINYRYVEKTMSKKFKIITNPGNAVDHDKIQTPNVTISTHVKATYNNTTIQLTATFGTTCFFSEDY